MAELSKAGLIRATVSQVWNKENHRLTRVFEYGLGKHIEIVKNN